MILYNVIKRIVLTPKELI